MITCAREAFAVDESKGDQRGMTSARYVLDELTTTA
jgi:hypothetical protein